MADVLVGRGVRRRAPTLFDLIEGPTTAVGSALGAMGSAAKGAAQATVGLPGDIESLVRMITGGEQTLPTTERVGQFVDQYIRAPYPQYEKLGEFTGLPTAGIVSRPFTQATNQAADALVRAITRNPQATAPGVLQETAMPFMQAVAPKMPGLLETPAKSELGFYSALEQATMPLQNKGTGAQFLAQIEKTAGVKPEEVKWTGLDEFLRSRQNVTKQEVQDYLAANRVNLQEVRLGEGIVKSFEQWAADQGFGPEALRDFGPTLRNSYEAFKENASQKVGAAKFSQYTLPGGENYREILLTLPRKTVEAQPMDISGFSVRTTENAMFPYTGQRDIEVLDSAGNVVSRRSGFRGTDQEAIQNYAGTVTTQAQKADESLLNYRSSHFEQPNILAHMRVNDRVVDGKKTLFIEEIQSDWHQAGRKKGYGPQTETTHEAYYTTPDGRRVLLGFGKTQEEAAAAVDPRWKSVVDVKFDTQTRKVSEGVPDAPFKTTWHELTLKRAIQEASEKGYDQIAFTTGKTQAERYDLSKQVDELLYKKNPDGTYRLSAQVRGRGQSFGDSIPESKLEEYVGKEVAKSITQGSGKDVNLGGPGSFTQPRDDWKSMSGLDLQVGGEGMKGFYDNILPKSLEKLGKKFDAKVGKTEMDGVEVWQMDITPKMRESVLTKGQPLFAATPAVGLLGRDEEQ